MKGGIGKKVVKERKVRMGVNMVLIIILPTLSYASEIWMWNIAQQLPTHTVEKKATPRACGDSRWDRESNENMQKFWYGCNSEGN